MLQDGNASVTDAAYGSGYNNISHFNRQFKTMTGHTAKEYRKKHYLAKDE
jgi:AraC-like DNA-binding protein